MKKKLYRLWYEYLKRSKPFEEFCTVSDKERRSVNPSTSVNPIQEKYPKTHLMAMFVSFGNPFEQSFDDWYPEQIERGISRGQNYCDWKAVCEIDFYYYVALANRLLASKGIEKPTRKDIGNELNELRESMQKLFLVIDLKATEKQVILRVKELFKERKKGENFSRYDRIASEEQGEDIFRPQKRGLISHSTLPTGKLNIDELQRYLDAYDMQAKNKTADEIYYKFGEAHRKKKPEYVEENMRMARRWIQNAKKIIQNLERAQEFPGTY